MSEVLLMNDVVTPSQPDGDLHEAAQPVSLSAGTMLRNARESSGLHVAALAVSMKIPVKKLEALEADRFDLLPDAVFVRALASSMCRALKIDPAPVLQKLPQNIIPRLDTEERGINAPFHSPGQAASLSVPAFFAKPAVLLVLALLVGVVGLAFFPEIQKPEQASDAVAVVPVLPPAAAVEEVTTPAEAAPANQEPVVVPAAVPAVTVAPPVVVASSPEMAKAVAPVIPAKSEMPGAAVDVAGASSGLVVFKVRGPSWVEVTDGKGVVQLRKTLVQGETIGASGALPLSVVVGRVDVTDVEVRGKAFSLAGIGKDNVARFEVK
jgi:cytoskeleton protein RodZ